MPRTIRNQFEKKLSYENLMKAHNLSKRGKGYRKEIILFNLKQEEYIMWLYEQLKNETYKHGGYTEFYVTEPKVRRIQKSRYIDRIVHRWIVDQFLKEYFETTFIQKTYACIKNRGMHKACLDVQNAMKHCKRIWQNYYILKMDIRKYFQNIDKDILMNILKRKVKEEKLVKLLEKIVYSNSGKKGLPIGNYTSQIFANIYLNEIDQYIKHELKVKYYFRYMDDSILFVKTKKEAIELLEKIKNYLKIKLELELNDKTQIFKSNQGVNFCGYKINEYRLKLRDRGKKAIKQKVRYLKEEVQKGNMSSKEASRFICGHLGYMKYANTRNLEEKLFYIN
jgi:RNA-directed DNA polymerase